MARTGEVIVLDPITETSTSAYANAPLQLSGDEANGISLLFHDYPPPTPKAIYASGPDLEGSRRVDLDASAYENRTIPVTLRVAEPTDGAATNLVTNPSFETGEAGWVITAGGFTVAATDLAPHAGGYVGDWSARLITNGAANSGTKTTLSGTFLSGVTYTARMRVRPSSGTPQVGIAIGVSGTDEAHANVTLAASGWTDVTLSWTPSANRASVVLALVSIAAVVIAVDIDAVQVIAESAPSTYFDGDTPGCAWTGTRHGSTSTRPVPGGDRLQSIVADVSEKVAKLNVEGGTYRRALPGTGDPYTFDVVGARVVSVDAGKRWGSMLVTEIGLEFECEPFARGADVGLSPHAETTLPVLTFTESVIHGDVPALGSLVISNNAGGVISQPWLVWGLRSRNYANEALFYEGEALSLPGGTAITGVAGASGGDTAQRNLTTGWVTAASLPTALVGTFRVFARVQTTAGVVAEAAMRLAWAPYYGTGTFAVSRATTNASTSLGLASAPNFRNVDLGMVSLVANLAGVGANVLYFQILGGSAAGAVGIDCVWFVPADEGSGEATLIDTIPALPDQGEGILRHDGYFTLNVSGVVSVVDKYEGDYLRVPPTGREGRKVQFVVRAANALPGANENRIDDISATLTYTPRWLNVPRP